MTCSRTFAVALAAGLTVVSPAVLSAQTRTPRVTVSVLTTREHVAIDHGDGTITGIGAGGAVRLTRFISVFGEITAGTGEVSDSYEADFVANGPILRRDRVWKAGVGTGFGVAFHTPVDQRAGVSLSIGLSGRSFDLTDTFTVVSLPQGWPVASSTGAGTMASSGQQGGLTVALGVPINVTRRVVIEPEIRGLRTLADEDFSEVSFGVKAGWRF